MKTVNYDALAASAPLNMTAAVVRDGGGEHWEAHVSDHEVWTDIPLPTQPVPENAEDLSGRTFGRLRVVGYFGSHHKAAAQWVVRCSCGGYGVRRSRAIRAAREDACCAKCNHAEHVKHVFRAATRGRWDDGSPYTGDSGLRTASGNATLRELGKPRVGPLGDQRNADRSSSGGRLND